MNPDLLFKKCKKHVIKLLGKGALDNVQLDELGWSKSDLLSFSFQIININFIN